MFDPVLIAGFIALFVAVGGLFLAVNLLVGRLVRPQLPNTEKLEVYECGEPTIGSSFVQFDLGKATQLSDPAVVSVSADGQTLTPAVAGVYKELGLTKPVVPSFEPTPRQSAEIISNRGDKSAGQAKSEWAVQKSGRMLARTAFVDMSAFYVILLVGFAYVWYRGDLDWVRAVADQRAKGSEGEA